MSPKAQAHIEAQNRVVNNKSLSEALQTVWKSFSIPDGLLGIFCSLETDESKSLALGEPVDSHFGGHDVAELMEHHFEAVVIQMIVQILDEQVVGSRCHIQVFDQSNSKTA